MAWRKEREPEPPRIPGWIGRDGFVPSDWAEPADFGLEPRAAEYAARARWIAERNKWLVDHPDVFDLLLEQLSDMCRDSP